MKTFDFQTTRLLFRSLPVSQIKSLFLYLFSKTIASDPKTKCRALHKTIPNSEKKVTSSRQLVTRLN